MKNIVHEREGEGPGTSSTRLSQENCCRHGPQDPPADRWGTPRGKERGGWRFGEYWVMIVYWVGSGTGFLLKPLGGGWWGSGPSPPTRQGGGTRGTTQKGSKKENIRNFPENFGRTRRGPVLPPPPTPEGWGGGSVLKKSLSQGLSWELGNLSWNGQKLIWWANRVCFYGEITLEQYNRGCQFTKADKQINMKNAIIII